MRKPVFAYAKTKAHISYLVTVQLISIFVFATCTSIVQSLYFLQPKFQASLAFFCGCTSRCLLELVRNPEDRFSHDKAHLVY